MDNNYKDYVFMDNKPVLKFEEMYKNCDDPWNISKEINQLPDYEFVLSFIRSYKIKEIKNEPQILEIGSGKGIFSEKIAELGCLDGFEISQTAVSYARKKHPEINFNCIDIKSEALDLKKKYDIIIFFRIIWYVIDHIDICMKNICNLLSLNGIVIFDINFYQGDYYGKNIISNKKDFMNILKKYFSIIESIDHYSDESDFNDFSIIVCKKK